MRRRSEPIVLALAASLLGVPIAHAQPRIVNGTPTTEYPSVAIIQTPIGLCSGVLVGCRTLLTAAHCFCGEVPGASCAADPGAVDASQTVGFLQHYGFVGAEEVRVHPDYAFGPSLSTADLAVVRLADVVEGVAPSPLADTTPATGSSGTIVGFGSRGVVRGDAVGTGVKREGPVETGACQEGLVCWVFSGTGANTCFGDSGGPLFVGSADQVAGITSGGTSDTCSAGDLSFDVDVAAYASWVAAQAGESLGDGACGSLPSVGQEGVELSTGSGSWSAGSWHTRSFEVAEGTQLLRVTTNGTLDGDADLLVRAGAEPTSTAFDCAGRNGRAFEACEVSSPVAGAWYVAVEGVTGAGDYQLTATTFGEAPLACGDGTQQGDDECGGGGGACDGLCTGDCACAVCDEGVLTLRRVQLAPRLRIRAVLADGAYPGFDPRAGFSLDVSTGDDTLIRVETAAGDVGWEVVERGYVWRGDAGGIRRISLRWRNGHWKIRVKGRAQAESDVVDRSFAVRMAAAELCLTGP